MDTVNKIILDSSVFIAFYVEEDALHSEAVNLIASFEHTTTLVPYCVIQEVCTVLTYRFGKSKALTFLRDVEIASNMILVEDDLYPEIEAFKKISAKLSFTDVSLVYLAGKYSAKLFTFDKDLLKLYKRQN